MTKPTTPPLHTPIENITNPDIDMYCNNHSDAESDLLHHIRSEAYRFAPQADMCSDRLSGATLRFLTQLHRPKNILELGLFFGYATLCMAEGAPDANITCLEWDGRVIDTAKDFFNCHPMQNNITVIHGNANDTLKDILQQQQFDFIFIDADKRAYEMYVTVCMEHLQSGGMMVVDNTLWRGQVLNPQDEKDMSVHRANQLLAQSPDFTNVLLPVRDGMHCAIKS